METIPKQIEKNRATVYRRMKGIKLKGINKFIRDYKDAKRGRKQPRKTDVLMKARIYKIREERRRCCGEKIRYFPKKEYGQHVSVSTIYRILDEKYVLRSEWKKYCKRGHVKRGEKPREPIQADPVDFGRVLAFTAIDTFTREAGVILQPALDARSGKDSLERQIRFFGSIEHIRRDGGPEFKKEWQTVCQKAYQKHPDSKTVQEERAGFR